MRHEMIYFSINLGGCAMNWREVVDLALVLLRETEEKLTHDEIEVRLNVDKKPLESAIDYLKGLGIVQVDSNERFFVDTTEHVKYLTNAYYWLGLTTGNIEYLRNRKEISTPYIEEILSESEKEARKDIKDRYNELLRSILAS
jgi:hypothetical protein